MAWRFPMEMPQTGAACDPDEVTAAMQPFIEELSGALDEHNFAASAFTRANIDDDAAMALFAYRQADDASTTTATANTGLVPMAKSWAPVTTSSGTDFADTVTTDEGMLWIMASFFSRQVWPGVLYAIAVDGLVLEESVSGGTEYSGETIRVATVAGMPWGPGICMGHHTVLLQTMVPVPAGTHTVQVVAYAIQADKTVATQTYEVYARELITIELVNA